MGLGNLTFPAVEVQTSGGSFSVRGLGFYDVLGLFYRHRESLTRVFDIVLSKTQKGESLDLLDVNLVMIEVLTEAPKLVAEVIAIGAGAEVTSDEFEGETGIAAKLPFAVQVDAIEKIARQTFTEDMPPKKLFALVMKAANQAGANP